MFISTFHVGKVLLGTRARKAKETIPGPKERPEVFFGRHTYEQLLSK